ncbi:LysE family translocator [Bacillus infantis]|uniref:LysE family transporter n=1 Tax=Bacillus infantis TaxID=324767 RepID=UPI001CD367F9|nr:LysE family transporter [Bacillus infantis]MCA1039367.1 LysE family translocator [Bacillus infantis]
MSIGIYISYIVLGLSLAAPIGPVNAVRLEKGLKNGFWHAWIVGAGSMIADGVYMLIVYLGLVQFLDSPVIQTFLWLFGGFILLYSGIEGMMNANKISVTYIRSKESLLKCFFTGFIMSVSSPLSILFWLGIYGSVLAKTASSFGTGQLLAYSLMIFIGLGLWDIFVAGLTSGFRRFLTSKAIIIISMLSGLSLILFGVYFGYQGIASLFG